MLIQILLIGVSVSMDAFAVSIGKGLTVKKLRGVDALKTALWFGGFQALFPLLGYFAASTFSKYVTAVDHWIIFGLLALIGGNMVREAFEEDEENAKETPEFDWKHMLPLAVACSIDAFAVGVSFAFMTLNIWLSVVIIGVTTGLFFRRRPVYRPRVRLAVAEAGADRRRRRADPHRPESAVRASRLPRLTLQPTAAHAAQRKSP